MGGALRRAFLAAAIAVAAGQAAAAMPTAAPAAASTVAPRSAAGLRLASLDGIDADLVYEKMGLDVRSAIIRLHIARSDGGTGICMGSLIDRRFVLTAGHCLRGAAVIEASRQAMRGGVRETMKVHSWIIHPQADTTAKGAGRLPETRSRPTTGTVHLYRDLGLAVLEDEFPGDRPTLRLPDEHALHDWNRSAAVLGFDRDRVSRALTDRLALIPLNDVHGFGESGGTVYVGTVGVVFDHELKDVPVPPRLAYCQGDSGAPILAHLRIRPPGGGEGRYEVRLIGVSALGAKPVTRPGRRGPEGSVDCFRNVVWFSLVNPALRAWVTETEAVLRRRVCGETPDDPWCAAKR